MLSGDKPGVNLEAAFADGEVVEARDEINSAQLLHLHSSASWAKVERETLQRDHAMADAVEMRILSLAGARHVVDEHDGGVASDEELLEPENLAAVVQGILRQEPHLGETVEHDTPRLDPFDFLSNQFDGFAELYFPGVDNGLLVAAPKALFRALNSNTSKPDVSKPCDSATTANSSLVSESVM